MRWAWGGEQNLSGGKEGTISDLCVYVNGQPLKKINSHISKTHL